MRKLQIDTFKTDLGEIELSVESNSIVNVLKNELKIETNDFQIEIRKFNLNKFSLPLNQSLKNSCGWQLYFVKHNNANVEIAITCKLIDPKSDLDYCSESGENLDAIKIENAFHHLHIGTEDGEIMQQRAKSSDWFPARLTDFVSSERSITETVDFGFKTTIPQLEKDEQLYLHYLIACNDNQTSEENVSTWLAVEQSKQELDKYSW